VSDFNGAAIIAQHLPAAKILIADKGYDADWFREFLALRGIEACIPPRSCRKADTPFNRATYRLRYKIENMFARIKDWRRVATRYDRCAHAFLSTITIAATVSYWL
jgi:transposase